MLAIREPPLRAPDLRAGAALVNAAAQHDSRVGYEWLRRASVGRDSGCFALAWRTDM